MRTVLSDKPDPAAMSFVRLAANPVYNAQLRTTCVATMLSGGHAVNALPQLASAKVNCRIMPGEPVDEVKATLERVLADDQITVTQLGQPVLSAPSALHEEIMGSIEKLTGEFWPGAVVLPTMSAGATDGSYLRNAGIPTYGHSGLAGDINDIRAHGKDERVLDKIVLRGRGVSLPAGEDVVGREFVAAADSRLIQRAPHDAARTITAVAVSWLAEGAGQLPFLRLITPLRDGVGDDVVRLAVRADWG